MDWGVINVNSPPRGPGEQPAKQLYVRSINGSFAWGVSPSTAVVTYVAEDLNSPLVAGASAELQILGRSFHGIAKSDVPVDSSSGKQRVMEFLDERMFLDWDVVFGVFNRSETRMVGGVRVRRWWHIYPVDWASGIKTFTSAPLTAAQILDALFTAPTIGSPWTRTYHSIQTSTPVYELDFSGGVSLAQAVAQIGDAHGLVVAPRWMVEGHFTAPRYSLYWAQKGSGDLPLPVDGSGYLVFPEGSEEQRRGVTLSLAPTRCLVTGGRNRYQVLNVPMSPDWNRNWEEFWEFGLFVEWVFNNLTTPAPVGSIGGGVPYKSIPDDPEQIIGGHLAMARALEITVREVAAIRTDLDFSDTRLYAGRGRMDLPAALYIGSLMFRAFRPTSSTLLGFPLWSINILGSQLASVLVDPEQPSPMYFGGSNAEGSGVAVVRGYQVGAESFRLVRPDRFRPEQWSDIQAVWQTMGYSLDQSGEDSAFILFDQPVIRSDDLFQWVDGFAVPNSAPVFQIPPVKASLTFEAERFQYFHGLGSLDITQNVPALWRETLVNGAYTAYINYTDGQSPETKAAAIGAALVSRQWAYILGGYTLKVSESTVIPGLKGTIDRVDLETSDQGHLVRVDFTGERGRDSFEPSRELDRWASLQTNFPGQAELRAQADASRLLAVGLRGSREAYETFATAFGAQARVAISGEAVNLPAGTALWKDPTVSATATDQATKTQVYRPADNPSTATVFAGITLINDWPSTAPSPVRTSGDTLALVKGPVSVNAAVGRDAGALTSGVLVSGGNPGVGTALQAVATGQTKLIMVRLGSGGGGSEPVWLP